MPTSRTSKGTPVVRSDDDGFPSIVIPFKQPSSRKTTPLAGKRPEFLEPLSPNPMTPSPWDTLQMTESDYHAMQKRVNTMYKEMERKDYHNALLDELKDPRYWKGRIELLETEREFFNKKRGWSAADIACVESIDAQIRECEQELEAMDE